MSVSEVCKRFLRLCLVTSWIEHLEVFNSRTSNNSHLFTIPTSLQQSLSLVLANGPYSHISTMAVATKELPNCQNELSAMANSHWYENLFGCCFAFCLVAVLLNILQLCSVFICNNNHFFEQTCFNPSSPKKQVLYYPPTYLPITATSLQWLLSSVPN